ncbi:hypothetical protein RN001_005853 [Aquatica leii]|uniref:SWIM-type domain-containing protein n=1 Tax=Aquatica leii TaxID=1421715 RepID=A0AAN7PCW3_9COLE|nr:hypothetical protein RN001_005853 [Aquatica leii]
MQGNHAIKFHFIAKYFKNDEKQLSCGENAYTSGHIKSMQFNVDIQPAYLKDVKASMKKRIYKVEAYIHLTEGIISTSCTCPRGQAICHHMAALLYYAHDNISSTDKAREWGPTQSKKGDAENTLSIDQLYPRVEFTAMVEEMENSKIETFRRRLGNTNVVGFSWYLKPEAENIVYVLVPPIDEILFSEDKDTYLIQKCSLDADTIKQIAAVTVGQHKNEGWLVSRKMRLTASKFGAILGACRRNKYPKSLFKGLLEGYNLNRSMGQR